MGKNKQYLKSIMNYKMCFKLIIFLIFLGCSEKQEYNNIENYNRIEIGDRMTEVVEKMGHLPDQVIIPDSKSLYQVTHENLTTFVYKTPRGASSHIHIYFEDCQVLDKFYD